MSKKKFKTNAMRILDSLDILYNEYTYDADKGHVDGVTAAQKIGKSLEVVFKTLVTQGQSKSFYVFVIPVDETLDMKKAAKVCGEKRVDMINVKDINKITGYIRGGCSPIGMKKQFDTFIHISAQKLDSIVVSAGKIGYQMELSPNDLVKVTNAKFADIIE